LFRDLRKLVIFLLRVVNCGYIFSFSSGVSIALLKKIWRIFAHSNTDPSGNIKKAGKLFIGKGP
jgi:hypothetical protein